MPLYYQRKTETLCSRENGAWCYKKAKIMEVMKPAYMSLDEENGQDGFITRQPFWQSRSVRCEDITTNNPEVLVTIAGIPCKPKSTSTVKSMIQPTTTFKSTSTVKSMIQPTTTFKSTMAASTTMDAIETSMPASTTVYSMSTESTNMTPSHFSSNTAPAAIAIVTAATTVPSASSSSIPIPTTSSPPPATTTFS
ncbi:uncharacterized protein [Mytilus edulis]|uniref:uncharacterized protein n=1 Tax=Mytilus edulis TaxID=6550 RepID=UPI0039EE9F37